ncbi:EF-P beta-lysylation protein EpmB [Kangiella koreensis]|uniref:L-lysine 2,3-aminomutase n=1 Tax=Kangiella koreensis (strain DSM 16069 / JCM 12317 / KCTC 12182 / SW-125) TaxID=523791 RepID=C7R6I4_KANKD|nr:EF-P beta-lysylation protein EpmB [Kangiella koreensis]ACV27412.1 lysine 2,3-aminomutase YodO family protein [Kangiella koreensis DSM 16069]
MIQNLQILPRNDSYWQEREWKKLLSQAISSPFELLSRLNLTTDDLPYTVLAEHQFMQKVPAPFVECMEKGNPNDPLLRQVLAVSDENQEVAGFVPDPLQEQNSEVPGLLHKYRSRVLVMLSTACAINCRYCFRREFPYQEHQAGRNGWQPIFDYLTAHPEINEVILSGGDPLAVNDSYLKDFIQQLERIPSIIRLRIHTRLPLVIPQRVTQGLIDALLQTRLQTVVVLHINHPNEMGELFAQAVRRLHQNGIHLLNQSVLLDGVNNNSSTLAELSEKLFAHHILPYYLHQLDKVRGAHHFAVEEAQAIKIMQELNTRLAGFLVPKLVREEAGKTSKTPIDLGLLTLDNQ